ncbi:BON domain-containing protein [Streptomyces avidinii]|uniref:CBS domain-containing protein n=1 Tax=Streptomyces avidinii TaxID=1895 RepID=A0ABS4L7P7_STRAV|nr:CBS domain-containing protein [Streptomyces avidinii]GGZ06373.1 hypothetical protein GCM10010343_35390 [Streptomyces avidinii]
MTVRPTATLPQAARLMAERHVKRLPVVDADGTVSRADLLKVFLRSDDELAAEIRHEVVEPLFPVSRKALKVDVTHGVVTLTGKVRDAHLIPMATRLAQAVEGIVSVHNHLVTLAPSTDDGA